MTNSATVCLLRCGCRRAECAGLDRCQHSRPARNGWRACVNCADDLRDMLRELPELYTMACLPSSLLKIRSGSGRAAKGYESQSPARDEIIVIKDLRSQWDATGEQSVRTTVASIGAELRDELGLRQPETVTLGGEVGLILDWLDRHLLRQEWIDNVWTDIRGIYNTMRRLNNRPRDDDDHVGRCLGTVTGEECSGHVFVVRDRHDRPKDECRCRRCHRSYSGLDWIRLKQQEAS